MKTTIKISIISFLMSMLMSGCGGNLLDDKLTLEKRVYNGTELRTDGYYYLIMDNGAIRGVTFFYENGIILYVPGSNSDVKDIEDIDKSLLSADKIERIRKTKTNWGLFQVTENNITLQSWSYSDGGGLPVYTRYGIIANDTTFDITKKMDIKGNKLSGWDIRKYHFRQFSQKPDSTNVFIP